MIAASMLALGTPVQGAPADFSGLWIAQGDGLAHSATSPPLTAAATAALAKARADAAKGDVAFDPVMHCLPHGTPRMMLARTPFQILVTPARVVFLHQWNHVYRIVYLDRAHDPAVDPSFMGDSIGHWDGAGLTIDTVNLRAGLLDASGIPTGEKLHVVEHYRLGDGGKSLVGTITVDDPETFTRPWSFPVTMMRSPSKRLAEQICADTPKAARANIR